MIKKYNKLIGYLKIKKQICTENVLMCTYLHANTWIYIHMNTIMGWNGINVYQIICTYLQANMQEHTYIYTLNT